MRLNGGVELRSGLAAGMKRLQEVSLVRVFLPVGGCFYTPEKNLPFSFYIAQLAQLGPWRVLCGYKKRYVAVLGLAAGL